MEHLFYEFLFTLGIFAFFSLCDHFKLFDSRAAARRPAVPEPKPEPGPLATKPSAKKRLSTSEQMRIWASARPTRESIRNPGF